MTILRYVGDQPVSFTHLEVHPGDEFLVPDELAETFSRRDDVVEVVPAPDPTPSLAEPDTTAAAAPPGKKAKAAVVTEDATPADTAQEG